MMGEYPERRDNRVELATWDFFLRVSRNCDYCLKDRKFHCAHVKLNEILHSRRIFHHNFESFEL